MINLAQKLVAEAALKAHELIWNIGATPAEKSYKQSMDSLEPMERLNTIDNLRSILQVATVLKGLKVIGKDIVAIYKREQLESTDETVTKRRNYLLLEVPNKDLDYLLSPPTNDEQNQLLLSNIFGKECPLNKIPLLVSETLDLSYGLPKGTVAHWLSFGKNTFQEYASKVWDKDSTMTEKWKLTKLLMQPWLGGVLKDRYDQIVTALPTVRFDRAQPKLATIEAEHSVGSEVELP